VMKMVMWVAVVGRLYGEPRHLLLARRIGTRGHWDSLRILLGASFFVQIDRFISSKRKFHYFTHIDLKASYV
jgi:hypothetical protein